MDCFKKSDTILDGGSSEWDASEHPRDKGNGQFVIKGETGTFKKSSDLTDASNSEALTTEQKGDKIKGQNGTYDLETGEAVSYEFSRPTPKEFISNMTVAKESNPPEYRWRVDIHNEADYAKDKLFTTAGGSCAAVEPDGNIISVCKNWNGHEKGIAKALMKKAVSEGGDRLDAFGERLFAFYTRNGFELVSWTPFNEEYAPEGWEKTRDKPEPVIFYRYTGGKTEMSYSSFLAKVPASKDYDEAKHMRDGGMKK